MALYPRPPLQTEQGARLARGQQLQTGPPTLDPRNGLAQYSWPPNATGQGPVTKEADEKEGDQDRTGAARSVHTSPTRGRLLARRAVLPRQHYSPLTKKGRSGWRRLGG
ncbi:hypothetical protein MTO96_000051 [Rhipicephalus appendiculatus]